MFSLFRKSENSQVDTRLKQEMIQAFSMMGIPEAQAKEMSSQVLQISKDEITKAGTRKSMYQLGFGDALLASKNQDPDIKDFIEVRGKHRVTEDDIRNWYNLCELERVVLFNQDKLLMLSILRNAKAEGKSEKEAAELMRKVCVRYIADAELIGEEGFEDLLPIELKPRVNAYRMSTLNSNPAELQREIEAAGRYNTWVRTKISNGEI